MSRLPGSKAYLLRQVAGGRASPTLEKSQEACVARMEHKLGTAVGEEFREVTNVVQ